MRYIILMLFILILLGVFLIIHSVDNYENMGLIPNDVKVDSVSIDPNKELDASSSSNLFIDGAFTISNPSNNAQLQVGSNTFTESDLKNIINNPIPYEKYGIVEVTDSNGDKMNKSVPEELCFGDYCINKEHLKILNGTDGVLLKAEQGSKQVNERGPQYADSPYYVPSNLDGPYFQPLKVDMHEGLNGVTDGYPPGCMPASASCNAKCAWGHGWTDLGCPWTKCWKCPDAPSYPITWHDGNINSGHKDLDVLAATSDQYNINEAIFKLIPGSDTNVTCM